MRGFWMGLLALALIVAPAAAAQSPEARIRETITRWYEELAKKDKGRFHQLTAPGIIDASPHYEFPATQSAALRWPPNYTSLAARALKFDYAIEQIRRDATFAKVRVWERGYFYAAAAQATYENAASTLFILERQEKDRGWRVLAHRSNTIGIPPNKITRPLPDLRGLYYSTQGKHRDPVKDAEAARNF